MLILSDKQFTSCPVTPARSTYEDIPTRPKTCLPHQRPPQTQTSSRSRSAKHRLIPVLSQKWTPENSTSGYRLRSAPLYAKGSKRTLQIATGVDSAAHAHRMRTINSQ